MGMTSGMTGGATFTARRGLPFLVVIVLCALSPVVPHSITPKAHWWIIAGALIVVLVGAGVIATRLPNGHWWHTVTPMISLPIIQFLRAADGFSTSGFVPMLFLPVTWFALYAGRRQVVLSLIGCTFLLIWPILLIGAPRYPAPTLRGSLLLLLVLVIVGLLINGLVESSRRATGDLRMSERRFRAAFDNAPVGMALAGVTGARAGYFLRVNQALCAMFGRTAEELTAAPIATFTHPDDVASTVDRLTRATTSDTARLIETRFVHKSGATIWAALSFSVIRDEAGAPQYLISQIEDIGSRRESDQALLNALESERRSTERMRELDRVRTEVFSNIAHDLRSPLTAAAGFTELLADGSVGALTPRQKSLLATVDRSLSRIANIVDEMPAASHPEPVITAPSKDVIDIGDTVDTAVQTMAMIASMHGQALSYHCELNGVLVAADASRIGRALLNLIGNAVKYTPDTGHIDVDARRFGDRVVIVVSDDGIGIPADDQERVFERSFRSATAKERAISGTGLGLAIVKEIVTQYGGTIAVESEPGYGSAFTMTLPALPAEQSAEVGATADVG